MPCVFENLYADSNQSFVNTPDSTRFDKELFEASPITFPFFLLICLHLEMVFPVFDE